MIDDTAYKTISTPAYLFDLDALTARVRMIRRHLGEKIRLVYAMKANPFLVEPLLPLVDGFEVCSPGEERICRRLNVPAEKMILSGVNKEKENFREIICCYGEAAVYTAESPLQLHILNELAMEQGLCLNVLMRLSGGNQFGMDRQTISRMIALQREEHRFPGLKLGGLQLYTGTQKKWKRISRELSETDPFLQEHAFQEFEYGPGLPVAYFESDPPIDEEQMLDELRLALEQTAFQGTLTLEIGRFLTASCGSYAVRVVDLKKTEDASYCIVDGGIHQMNYYGQTMAMKIPQIQVLSRTEDPVPEDLVPEDLLSEDPVSEDPVHWTICGSLCTTADVLVRDFPVSNLKINDIMVFGRTGAYSMTEGISLFLSRDLPAVYFWKDGKAMQVRQHIQTEEWNNGRIDGTA